MSPSTSARRRCAVVLLAAAALLLPATSAAAATAPAEQPEAGEAQPAWVRATHLVPDLPQMDVSLVSLAGGGTTTVEGAGYGDVSTYVRVPAGGFTVEVRGEGADPASVPVLSTTLQADPGRAYTIAALGTAQDARLVPLQDDLTPPAQGQARVRVLSAASSASSVDVSAVDGPVVARGAAFGGSTTYADVPAGRWTLRAAAASGTTTAAATTAVDLAAGSTYTLAVTDGPDGELQVTPVADAAGAAAVPVGGAATGAGGTATAHPDAPALVGGSLGALAAAGLGALVLVRRSSLSAPAAAGARTALDR
ncbi:DUF4397 domain-containing protein [Quadrisphaera sp. INWT6]|uniref:DUF4397 domain-containing protein n=1 Tax=Quadrisphaera sp. INWT6 TaxID=2596917 RepID=UPI001891FD90|nr:DUF4397 domain-containing protein [Quadrisphaera sp. INWT6]